jgi:hypothetical protein
MSLLTATPASLREALRAGADRFAGCRTYKYFAPTEPFSNPAAAGLGYSPR